MAPNDEFINDAHDMSDCASWGRASDYPRAPFWLFLLTLILCSGFILGVMWAIGMIGR